LLALERKIPVDAATALCPVKDPFQGEVKLVAGDRCDRCGARAMIRVASLASGADVQFCGHHYSRYEVALVQQGFTVTGRA
jgi:hypothetical protein